MARLLTPRSSRQKPGTYAPKRASNAARAKKKKPDPPPAALSKPPPELGVVGSEGALTGALAATTGTLVVAEPPKVNNPAEPGVQNGAGVRGAGPAILGADWLKPGLATFTGADQRDCAVAAEFPEAGECPDQDVWVVT